MVANCRDLVILLNSIECPLQLSWIDDFLQNTDPKASMFHLFWCIPYYTFLLKFFYLFDWSHCMLISYFPFFDISSNLIARRISKDSVIYAHTDMQASFFAAYLRCRLLQHVRNLLWHFCDSWGNWLAQWPCIIWHLNSKRMRWKGHNVLVLEAYNEYHHENIVTCFSLFDHLDILTRIALRNPKL